MNYYDKVIDPLFKKIDESRSIFYSAGKLNKGYIIDKETEKQIKGFLKTSFKITIIFILVLVIIHKLLPLVFLAIYTPIYFIKLGKFLKHSEKIR